MKKVLFLIAALAFSGFIFAQEVSYWQDIDYHQFENHDPFIAKMSLDNHIFIPDDTYAIYEVAAFVGEDDYRGHGFLSYDYVGDPNPVLNFEIYYKPVGNTNEVSKPVYFKLYDHNTGKLYDYWTCDVEINTQTMYNNWDFDEMPTLSFFTTNTIDIAAYTANGGYYLIASPLNQTVSPEDVLNMTSNSYDLYAFDQNPEDGLEWRNYKADAFDNLEAGKGYLYANSENITLTFIGAPYNGDGVVSLDRTEGVEFAGWNLVGNPFDQTAYITKEFYTMKDDGSEIIAGSGNSVQRMQGIFVVADYDGETMTFSTTDPNQVKEQIVLNVNNRDGILDRAIVRFDQSSGMLPKFMLNQNNTKMYIRKNGNDFAVVRSNKSGTLPVYFKPAQDGTYTISVNTEDVEVRYLHLIDNVEHMDIDLLLAPNYKFEAKTNDDAKRFELVFRTGTNLFKELSSRGNTEDFGFYSDGNWIINNEGDAILQVVDVNGQILSNEEISGCCSKHIEAAPGVYMLRLINGKDTKVQKIVIK